MGCMSRRRIKTTKETENIVKTNEDAAEASKKRKKNRNRGK